MGFSDRRAARRGDEVRRQRLVGALSPDGRRVVTMSGDRTARLWDMATGAPFGAPMRHDDLVVAASFSPDGRWIVTSSQDATARLWIRRPVRRSAARWSTYQVLGLKSAETASGSSRCRGIARRGYGMRRPARRLACPCVTKALFGGRIQPGRNEGRHPGWKCCAAMGCSDRRAARRADAARAQCCGGRIQSDGQRVVTASWIVRRACGMQRAGRRWARRCRTRTTSLRCISADGRRIVTVSSDHTVRLWDATTGEPVAEPMRHERRFRFVFSPDGQRIAIFVEDEYTARLWDWRLASRSETDAASRRSFGGRFQPRRAARRHGIKDRTARLWEAATGAPLGDPMKHESDVEAATFSPDGQRIVTASGPAAQLWNVATGAPLGVPMRHERAVEAAASARMERRSAPWPKHGSTMGCGDRRAARRADAASSFRPDGRFQPGRP